ncbi:hypothetical protein VTK73DRAFT_8752 [Phialemonium thermophilum]|uniref:Erythromycin biosynthesis protein CIII-like C-terminal domain-containing protein n=1 Tax=Phialemonium thermophilum TaxID=223376 RepID=A0ABR3W737_9PEZI
MDAVAHHGGSGTTGASLRAGVPTIVRPFFGDQFFFGTRVEDLGVGICLKKWGAHSFARALWEATHSERMIVKARLLGEQIRRENGVDTAIQCIYRDLEYAKSLILAKVAKNAAARKDGGAAGATSSGSATPGGRKEGGGEDDDDEEREVEDDDEEEESWTFVTGGDVDDEEIREAAAAAAAGGGGSVGFRKHLEGTRALGSRVLGGVRAT